ncbi:MAG: hypothetical protein ACQGQO_04640 [Sphaerochaetaceae bacterium]
MYRIDIYIPQARNPVKMVGFLSEREARKSLKENEKRWNLPEAYGYQIKEYGK